MQILVNVKHSLYKIFLLFGIGYLISSCVGGGDSYTSTVCYDHGSFCNGFKVSQDRRSVKGFDAFSQSNWVDIKQGGVGFIYNHPNFEIKNNQVRVKYGYNGNWGSWVDLCGSGESVSYDGSYAIKVEVNNGQARYCFYNGRNWICGNWVSFDKNYICHSCPQGYTYNANRNICEADPICNNGTYDPNTKKCYIGDYTCPIGNYECLKLSDEKNYCSPNICVDVSNPSNFENTDTIQGANDKQADGQIDQNGNCLGTIYIFNGKDKRCRKPGTQTLFNDCCKKDEIELLNLVTLGKCKSDEQYLAKLRSWGRRDGRCHYVGEYCAEKIKLGFTKICIQRKKTFCCFNSPLARIIQEQGRNQLGISWGTPKNPNCRGFTPEEFQKLDWNKIDFSEWIENEVVPNVQSSVQNNLQNTINNIKNTIQNKY